MNKQCDLVKDLLPLYVDGVVSEGSREMVAQHLQECEDCRSLERKIRDTYIEKLMDEDRAEILSRYASKERSIAWKIGVVCALLLFAPLVLVCMVMVTGNTAADYGALPILASSLLVAASVTAVPLMSKKDRLSRTLLSLTASILLTLFFGCLWEGDSFAQAGIPTLFGLSLIFAPFVAKGSFMPSFVKQKKWASIGLWDFLFLFLTLLVAPMPRSEVPPFQEGMLVCELLAVIVWTIFAIVKLVGKEMNSLENAAFIAITILLWVIFVDSCAGLFMTGFKEYLFGANRLSYWAPSVVVRNITLTGLSSSLFIGAACSEAYIIKSIWTE